MPALLELKHVSSSVEQWSVFIANWYGDVSFRSAARSIASSCDEGALAGVTAGFQGQEETRLPHNTSKPLENIRNLLSKHPQTILDYANL